MSQRLGQLLVKALNGLPPEEQGELLGELLGRRTIVSQHAPSEGLFLGPSPGPIAVAALKMIEGLHAQSQGAFAQSSQEAPLKVLPVRLPATDYERLRAWSKSHDFSMAVIVRTLVERFLDGQGGDGKA
jgi:hypothetical protein